MANMYMNLRTNASLRYSHLLVLVLAVAFVFGAVCVGGACGADAWDGEDRTEPSKVDGVYQISTGAELAYVAERVNAGDSSYVSASYILTADIDLNNKSWTAIGASNKKFSGTFDGSVYKISNLYCHLQGNQKVGGLFGTVENGIVRNVTINHVSVTAQSGNVENIGCIVTYLKNSSVLNCSIIGDGNIIEEKKAPSVGAIVCEVQYSNGTKVEDPNTILQYVIGCSAHNVLDKDGEPVPIVAGLPVDSEKLVQAKYTILIYRMNTSGGYEIEKTDDDHIGTVGLTVRIPAEDYVDAGFSIDGNSILSGTILSDGSLELTVKISRNKYTLTILSDESGTVGTSTEYYYYDTEITSLQPPLKPGYGFREWNVTLPFKMPANNLSILALWTAPDFIIEIPESLTILDDTYCGNTTLKIDITTLSDKWDIVVTAKSESGFNLKNVVNSGITLKYNLWVDNNPVSDSDISDGKFEIGKFSGNNNQVTIPLNASVTQASVENLLYSGSYEDTLIFTFEYSEKNTGA